MALNSHGPTLREVPYPQRGTYETGLLRRSSLGEVSQRTFLCCWAAVGRRVARRARVAGL